MTSTTLGLNTETLVLAQTSESPGCERHAAGGKGTLHRCPGSDLETKAKGCTVAGSHGWNVGRGPSIVLEGDLTQSLCTDVSGEWGICLGKGQTLSREGWMTTMCSCLQSSGLLSRSSDFRELRCLG